MYIRNKSTPTSNTKALEFQEQSQAPPPFPKTKHAGAHPLVSSCNHLLLQVLLQQVMQEKEISKKNILKSSIQLFILILPKYFPRGFAKGTWSSGKWQVIPTREFTYPKFSQMFPKTFFSGNIFFLISGECKKPYWSRAGLRQPDYVSFP